MKTITLDAHVIEAIAGHYDEALRLIEERFGVRLAARGNDVTVHETPEGGSEAVRRVGDLLQQIGDARRRLPTDSGSRCS